MKVPKSPLTLALTFAAVSLSACQTTKQEPVNVTSSLKAESGGKIHFESWSPQVNREAFNTPKSEREKVVVSGDLNLPEDSASYPVPAMVVVHGSGGTKATNNEWIERLNAAGVATFELDSFSGREVSSTVGNQGRVRGDMMVSDAFNALELLATHPRIDAKRIGIMGFSKGGSVSQGTLWERRRKSEVDSDLKFALHMPVYPSCVNFEEFTPTGAPIMMMVGGQDNWAPPEPCKEFINNLQMEGYPAKVVVFEDAYHSFDRARNGVSTVRDAWSTVDCDFVIAANGEMYEGNSNLPMNNPSEQRRALSNCAEKGTVKVGTTPDLKAKVFDTGINFITTNLLESST